MKDTTLELVDTLLDLQLSANQYVFLYLKYKKDDVRLYKYLEKVRPLSQKEMDNLEERGLIVNVNKAPNDYLPDRYLVTQKFVKAIEPSLKPAEEFWDAYPGFTSINGTKAALKAISKDDFLFKYADLVKRDKELHQRIMRALRYMKGRDEVKMRIDKWIDSRMWETVESELEVLKQTAIFGQKEI